MDMHCRRFLGPAAGGAPLALLATGAAAQTAAACYDSALPLSQKNRRRSLSYVEASTDPAKHCSACTFFTAAVCASFAPRGK